MGWSAGSNPFVFRSRNSSRSAPYATVPSRDPMLDPGACVTPQRMRSHLVPMVLPDPFARQRRSSLISAHAEPGKDAAGHPTPRAMQRQPCRSHHQFLRRLRFGWRWHVHRCPARRLGRRCGVCHPVPEGGRGPLQRVVPVGVRPGHRAGVHGFLAGRVPKQLRRVRCAGTCPRLRALVAPSPPVALTVRRRTRRVRLRAGRRSLLVAHSQAVTRVRRGVRAPAAADIKQAIPEGCPVWRDPRQSGERSWSAAHTGLRSAPPRTTPLLEGAIGFPAARLRASCVDAGPVVAAKVALATAPQVTRSPP